MIVPYEQNLNYLNQIKGRKIKLIFMLEQPNMEVWKGEFADGFMFLICNSLNILSVSIAEREFYLDKQMRAVGVFDSKSELPCTLPEILNFLGLELDKGANCDII